jgi:fructose-1-phosphate kinase PfkB-like protein
MHCMVVSAGDSLLASLLTSAKEARDLLTVLNSGVSTRQARVNSIRVYLLSE